MDEARRLANEGRYEQALQKHIFFHDHALKADPSVYGVRLSFALANWVDLGKKYPKAREVLKQIRNQKMRRVLAGERERDLLVEVASINEYLKERQSTVALFKQIDATEPEFALAIYDIVEKALVEARQYSLAKKYLRDPEARLAAATRDYERSRRVAKISRFDQHFRPAFERVFIEEVGLLTTILDNTGDEAVAKRIQTAAQRVVKKWQ